jgi:acetyl esterase/lipase
MKEESKKYYSTQQNFDCPRKVSPLLADDSDLACFPLTRLIVGDMDPLLDESIEFVKKLRSLNVEASIQVCFEEIASIYSVRHLLLFL